jgi:hypothetical protein
MQCFSVLLIFWYHSLWKKLVLSFFSYFENWDVFHLFYCDSLGKIFFILVEESITHLPYAIMKEHINSYVSAVLWRCHKNIKTGKFLTTTVYFVYLWLTLYLLSWLRLLLSHHSLAQTNVPCLFWTYHNM